MEDIQDEILELHTGDYAVWDYVVFYGYGEAICNFMNNYLPRENP
jgi:hypothetical protein